jgi:hypothetical protein
LPWFFPARQRIPVSTDNPPPANVHSSLADPSKREAESPILCEAPEGYLTHLNTTSQVTAFTDVVGITIAGIRCLHKDLAGGQPLEPNSYLHLLRASLYPIFCPPNPHSLVITVHQSKPRTAGRGERCGTLTKSCQLWSPTVARSGGRSTVLSGQPIPWNLPRPHALPVFCISRHLTLYFHILRIINSRPPKKIV